mmetsp:Transcript_23604/g.80624  ORF Transcript_23604/g.80624 Transcript_23604/m.80624 type:complete len:202 (+) Transcript_23604:167-772(+)
MVDGGLVRRRRSVSRGKLAAGAGVAERNELGQVRSLGAARRAAGTRRVVTAAVVAVVVATFAAAGGVVEERVDLALLDSVSEGGLADLAEEHLFFDAALRRQPINVHGPLLAVAPDARHGLLVLGGVPRRLEEDEPGRAGERQADAARADREQCHKGRVRRRRRVDALHNVLALVRGRAAVEARAGPAAPAAELDSRVEDL